MSKRKLCYEFTEHRQYKCCECGRTMHKPTPHYCKGEYRKHKLNFLKNIDMKKVEEVKSIEIRFIENERIFRTDFNGEMDEEGYELQISEDNALAVARTLTRLANVFWEKFDILANEKQS